MVHWLYLGASASRGLGSIPGLGTEIPQAAQCGQKKKKMLSSKIFLGAWICYGKGDLFQGLRVGSCPTLGNELSEESHMLRKQESLLRRDAWEESRRVREPRRTAAPCGSQSWVLW